MRTSALIWDFDGTLVDSRHKNLSVNRSIVELITGRSAGSFKALAGLHNYDVAVARATNWREFYARECGLTDSDIDRAASLWTEYQFRDPTPAPVFEGIPEALAELQDLPHGIVSQNGKVIIQATLEASGLAHHFVTVVGHEEVGFGRQKPAPDGLLSCLRELTRLQAGFVFYVGDHETDAVCAARARDELVALNADIELVSIGAFYGHETVAASWNVQPDTVARRPADIVGIVREVTR